MEIIDIRSGSPIAVSGGAACEEGGEIPGAVGRERRLVGGSREAPREGVPGTSGLDHSVKRGGDVCDCRAAHGVVEYKEIAVRPSCPHESIPAGQRHVD